MKMNLKAFVPSILAVLGLSEWKKKEGKDILDEQDIAKLHEMGFNDEFIKPFAEAIEKGFQEEDTTETTQTAVMKSLLAKTTNDLIQANSQLEAMKLSETTKEQAIAAKDTEIAGLKDRIKALSSLPEPDNGAAAAVPAGTEQGMNLSDENQLFGMQGEMYALDRGYNQRARAALLARQGISTTVMAASSMDYGRLKEDLGAFYRIPWQERIQSFLMKLPSLESVFPLEPNYQDLATLTNIWLGEFSQSDNTSSNFDDVVKGNYKFDSETLRMYSVMFAHKFQNLKELEKTWIGSLNREGSQVIKWSFIEYIMVETAKKLHNERELRRINGVRKDPDLGKPGRAMEASDGLYEWLRKKVDGFVDVNNGKTVYQIKPFVLGEINESNIGEKIFQATGMIPAVLRDSGSLVLYIPSHMIVWYHKYNELHYGTNQDYKAGIMYVKEYPSVKLVQIPNADNHQRLIWTLDGNIHLFEDAPGEMTRFSMEQQDWTLKVWSNWKESVWARAVGYKYTNKADMDYSRQMIFCNEYDRPTDSYVDSEKDKNPNVTLHTSVQTVANSSIHNITDIENAQVGQVVRIKCGSVDKGVKIKKSDKFSLISAEWNPNKGDVIRLMKRKDGKFIELGRSTAADAALQFAADDTTPSLANGTIFATDENSQATDITNFEDALEDKVYTIYGNGSTNASTIANSGNFVLTDAMTLKAGSFIQLVYTGGKFYEVTRG